MTQVKEPEGGRERMVLAKYYQKKKFKNGDKCKCGPNMRIGAYKNWNWCSVCTAIWDKTYKYCPDCNQMLRWKARGNSNWTWKK